MEKTNVLTKESQEGKNPDNELLNIVNEDWLSELSTTRFSLKKKNKGSGNVTVLKDLQSVSAITEVEDEFISQQNIDDEKIISTLIVSSVVKPVNEEIKEVVISPKLEKAAVVETQEVKSVTSSVPAQPQTKVEEVNTSLISTTVAPSTSSVEQKAVVSKEEDIQTNVLFKLIALGLAKLYIEKTNTILNPLRFVLENRTKVVGAAIQFIMPLLMTWWLTTEVPIFAEQLAKEGMIMQVIYKTVFYLACMFLWIFGQILVGSIFNMFKKTLTDVAKNAQNKS